MIGTHTLHVLRKEAPIYIIYHTVVYIEPKILPKKRPAPVMLIWWGIAMAELGVPAGGYAPPTI
jgi:hypothetical protein